MRSHAPGALRAPAPVARPGHPRVRRRARAASAAAADAPGAGVGAAAAPLFPPPLAALLGAAASFADPPPAGLLAADGGPPRFSCPVPSAAVAATRPDPSTLPILFFLTGLDGAGLAAWRAFDSLASKFDVRVLTVPAADRTPFDGLVSLVVDAVVAEVVDGAGAETPPSPTRPVYLAGESFGCLLALAAAAAAPGAVDRLVLVNPATCFSKSPWARLGPAAAAAPPRVYAALPWLLAPALGNPLNIVAGRVAPGATPGDALAQLAAGVAGLLPQLGALGAALPAATLSHRLELLKTGEAAVNPLLPTIRARALVVAGARDSLLPSAREAERLVKVMPRARSIVLPNATHAMLQEAGVDLMAIIEQKGFYEAAKRTSTAAPPRRSGAAPAAAPVHLPTPGELDAWTERATRTVRRLTSPVFLSTTVGAGGAPRVVRGLAGLPRQGPTLFVGNHQLMALDMGMMVEEVYRETGILMRGLAHPAIFTSSRAAGVGSFEAMLTEWGAVPVGPRNFHRLLSAGESVLLFPGGAREAAKLKGEAYRLFWPAREEFVRFAARFGATIVPFSAVGCEDSLRLVLDASEIAGLPVIGPALQARMGGAPPARRGVSADASLESEFLLPLAVPSGPPDRMYFKFGAPIPLDASLAADRAAADAVYRDVKAEVEAGIAWLRSERERDPYRGGAARLPYEAVAGGRQAPTFGLD